MVLLPRGLGEVDVFPITPNSGANSGQVQPVTQIHALCFHLAQLGTTPSRDPVARQSACTPVSKLYIIK